MKWETCDIESGPDFRDAMAKLGDRGWELVSVVYNNRADTYHAFLKRPKELEPNELPFDKHGCVRVVVENTNPIPTCQASY